MLLNWRTAPGLYLRVGAITREPDGNLAFDGSGEAIDWVVVMRRFDERNLFDTMAEEGRLDRAAMRALGAEIAGFHAEAAIRREYGGERGVRLAIDDNARELALVGPLLDGLRVCGLHEQTRDLLAAVAPLLERRREAGKVRRCHGDLRLANICLLDGRPTLFDCIEFSEDIGCIDTLYDLAFLLMDLDARGLTALANAAFNSYLDRLPDPEGLRALPLFIALRAATRSYALAGGAARQADPREAEHRLAFAHAHLEASAAMLRPHAQTLIAIGGGTADQQLARAESLAPALAPPPGARLVHLSTDSDAPGREAAAVVAAGWPLVVCAGDGGNFRA